MVDLEMLVEPMAMQQIYDIFDLSAIHHLDDGTLSISVSLPENDWLYSMLVSLGTNLKQLKPDFLREKLISHYQEALENLKEKNT